MRLKNSTYWLLITLGPDLRAAFWSGEGWTSDVANAHRFKRMDRAMANLKRTRHEMPDGFFVGLVEPTESKCEEPPCLT